MGSLEQMVYDAYDYMFKEDLVGSSAEKVVQDAKSKVGRDTIHGSGSKKSVCVKCVSDSYRAAEVPWPFKDGIPIDNVDYLEDAFSGGKGYDMDYTGLYEKVIGWENVRAGDLVIFHGGESTSGKHIAIASSDAKPLDTSIMSTLGITQFLGSSSGGGFDVIHDRGEDYYIQEDYYDLERLEGKARYSHSWRYIGDKKEEPPATTD